MAEGGRDADPLLPVITDNDYDDLEGPALVGTLLTPLILRVVMTPLNYISLHPLLHDVDRRQTLPLQKLHFWVLVQD